MNALRISRPSLYIGLVCLGILLSGLSFLIHPFFVLALTLLIFLTLISLLNIRLLPYFVFFALIVGQLARLTLSQDSSSAILLIDAATAIYVVFGLIYGLITHKALPVTFSIIFLIAFWGWMLISLLLGSAVLTHSETIISLLYALRLVIMSAVIIVTPMLFSTPKQEERLIHGLMTSGVILTILGYLQLILVPNFAFMAKFGWDPHQGRLLSTFFDPNFFGMFLVFVFSYYLAKLFFTKETKNRLKYLALLLLIGGAVVLTFSRSSYLALLIATFIIVTIRAWRWVVFGIIALAIVAVSVPRVRQRVVGAVHFDTTAQARLESWRLTWGIIQNQPVTGVGYNAFGYAQLRYGIRKNLLSHAANGSDSSLLLVLATTGIIGFTLFGLLLLALWYEAILVYRFGASEFFHSLGLAMIGIIPAYIIHSQFVNGLLYPLLLVPFSFLAAGLVVGLKNLGRSDAQKT